MAPTDDDQANERESRIDEMIKGYRPEPTTAPEEDRPHTGEPVPPGPDRQLPAEK